MTPHHFETQHAALWQELEDALDQAERRGAAAPAARSSGTQRRPPPGARLAELYRRSCEHLALAQARAYPIHLTQRLESLTQRAHRLIYRHQDHSLARLKILLLVDVPQQTRGLGVYLLAATLLFVLPALAIGWACYQDPGFILHLVEPDMAREFDQMYDAKNRSFGRYRNASTDWTMFGFYVMHNIGIGFQCFASGIFLGLGSVYFMLFNGVFLGGIAGYLTAQGHSENFWSFVITHGAFELTAIVMAGAAGLKIGHALLAPGRLPRLEALRRATLDTIVVVYGVVAMLVIAALIEAFWSSSARIAPTAKYAVGGICWVLVFAYLAFQGRPRREPAPQESHDAR